MASSKPVEWHVSLRSWLLLLALVIAGIGCSSVNQPQPGNPETQRRSDNSLAITGPVDNGPVTASMKADPTEIYAGSMFEILVRVEIAAAYHLYATNSVGKPFVPITLNLTLPNGVEAVSDWTAPPPTRTRSGDLIYTDSVQFRRSLRVGSNVSTGLLSIGGELRYQACTEELCWPPRALKLSTTVGVSSKR